MGSKTFEGVWFIAYSHDHLPAHAHGRYGETVVIVQLLPDGAIRQASRKDAVQPGNARRREVRHILEVASKYALELQSLWEKTHGPASE